MRSPLCYFFLVCLSLPLAAVDMRLAPPTQTVPDPTTRLGMTYLDTALQLAAKGDHDTARLYLDRGLDLNPANSDLWLAKARELNLEDGMILEALDAGNQALTVNSFSRAKSDDALDFVASLLMELHRYLEADSLIHGRYSFADLVKRKALLADEAEIQFVLGNRGPASALLFEGMKRYPEEPELVRIAIQNNEIPEGIRFLWFDRYRSNNGEYVKALFWYIAHLQASAERLNRINDYLNLGGTDRMVYGWAMESAKVTGQDQDSQWLDKFLAASSSTVDLDAVDLVSRQLANPDLVQKLNAFLKAPSLAAVRDFDRDGVPEQRAIFANGIITMWRVDANQDGLTDLEIDWEGPKIHQAMQERGSKRIILTFNSYPEVEAFTESDTQSRVDYFLPHRALEPSLIDTPPEGFTDPLQTLPFLDARKAAVIFDLPGMEKKAYMTNDYSPVSLSTANPRIVRQSRYVDGRLIGERVDSDGDGVFDILYWYENGKRVLGFRDLENNGNFNVLETWNADRLDQVRYSSARDNFTYTLKPDTGLAQWDINGDNRIDIQEMKKGNQILLQQFSSHLDGNFDITLLYSKTPVKWIQAGN